MDIRFSCQSCGQHIAATKEFTGQWVFCPQCGKPTTIPQESTLPPSTAGSQQDVSFNCQQCGQTVAIDDRAGGTRVRCPKCNTMLTVPTSRPPVTWSVSSPATATADTIADHDNTPPDPGSAADRTPRSRGISWLVLVVGLVLGFVGGMMLGRGLRPANLPGQPPSAPADTSSAVDMTSPPQPQPQPQPQPVPVAEPPAPVPLDRDDPQIPPETVSPPTPAPADDVVTTPAQEPAATTGLRTWTSASGKTLTARLRGVDGFDVVLEGTNGKRFKIDLSKLSLPDREFVRAVEPSAQAATKPVLVFILAGQSNMQGHGRIQANPNRNGGKGSLAYLVKNPATAGTFGRLMDEIGNWRARDDVWIKLFGRHGPLIPGYGAGRDVIGPELGFGWVIGDALEEPVLLIKCAWGGKSLAVDFRPPSAGRPPYSLGEKKDAAIAADPAIIGKYYRETLALTQAALADLKNLVPDSDGRYVLAGFGWHQGWNDRINDKFNNEYENNLAHFIRDMRRDLAAPGLPFVIAETGMTGPEEKHPRALSLMAAQAAVAEQPEFRGNVAFVRTRDFWRPAAESPSGQGYHWNSNAETYYLIGEAMGAALKQLLGTPANKPTGRREPGSSPGSGQAAGRPSDGDQAAESELRAALESLKRHCEGRGKLDDQQIAAHHLTIDTHRAFFGHNAPLIRAACDLVTTYDKAHGPLWIAQKGFNRKGQPPANDLHWTIYQVMQHIIDQVYTVENIARHGPILDGFKFGCSAHFPGAVEPPTNPNAAYRVKINGSYRKDFKHAVMHEERPARRPTGAYLAPGTIATVRVPASLVGNGYQVRVGAHSWDNTKKPRVLRLDRSSLVYPIDAAEIRVASPLGGGIYIEVPLQAAAGIVEVSIRNAVRAPFFSAKPFHQTTRAEWQNRERAHAAPWADFQSEKFMMQVPSSWIRKLDDPGALMKDWDAAMDVMNDLMGLPRLWDKETMYLQVDLQLRSRVLAPGYPTVNDRYDPRQKYNGYVDHYLVRGPQRAPHHVFHEMGHGYLFVKFGGEQESTVNLLHVAVQQQKFGASLDEAFRGSLGFGRNEHRTLDNTAVAWMTSFSFVENRPMAAAEKAYQLKGHAKFVDIVRLFGWEVLGDFWKSWVVDREEGRPWSKHGTDIDTLSLRLSQQAGVDLTPLLHFWGTPPRDAAALRAAVAAAQLPPAAAVYDTLVRYQALVPRNNRAFRDFAVKWWGKPPSSKGYWTEREHTQQWETFDEATAAAIRAAVQEIIDDYFPSGRPRAWHPATNRKQVDQSPGQAARARRASHLLSAG